MSQRITIARGDGIGPEIMDAVLTIFDAAGVDLQYDEITVGEKLYTKGIKAGIEPESWDVIRRNKILFKAPITTPQSGGVKSLNVTLRKTLGLYANVRPCIAYHPFIATKHSDMDVVIVRENEEDTYGGIEHRQTFEVYQCLKLISTPGSERIVRYAFEYARRNNRKRVTCFVKDNIMKLTDGIFHSMFKKVAAEYPDIQSDSMIVDIGAARLADTPEKFDVIVLPNLYGDIVSDIAAQIAGSVGLAGSANIGEQCAMFEAIHGSAPDIAGKQLANPSGLLMAGIMMLVHLGKSHDAERIHNAFLRTIEEGYHTADIYTAEFSKEKLSTAAFAQAVISNLGQKPQTFAPIKYGDDHEPIQVELSYSRGAERPSATQTRDLIGVDVFIYDESDDLEAIAGRLQKAAGNDFELIMFTNRGTKVWPGGIPETFCTDHWRCRFKSKSGMTSNKEVIALLGRVDEAGSDMIKTEHLYNFDGQPGYSLGQGE
jgi:isocitrate dehydrogenase